MLKERFWLGTLLLIAASLRAADKPISLFPQSEQIDKLSADKDWDGLQKSCKSALTLTSNPIADFSPGPHYGPAGVVAEGGEAPGPRLSHESRAVYDLALCAHIFHDNRFSSKAEEILEAWAHTTKRIGSEQGRADFNFDFPYALLGAHLLEVDSNWHSADFTRFVRDIVVPANNSDKPNNHANWGTLLLASAGGYLHDQVLINQARKRWLELTHTQMAEDGSLPLEICRSDTSNWCGGPTKGIKGIAYTHYALLPATVAAEIFNNLGQDVYSTPEGKLFCKAYAKAATWSLHPETFPYFAANGGKLIGVYGVNYFYIMQSRCPTLEGAAVLNQFGAATSDPFRIRTLYNTK